MTSTFVLVSMVSSMAHLFKHYLSLRKPLRLARILFAAVLVLRFLSLVRVLGESGWEEGVFWGLRGRAERTGCLII